MVGKKLKQPRIILRKTSIRHDREEDAHHQIPASILNDCDEKNVQVLSGFAFFRRSGEGNQQNQNQGKSEEVGRNPNWPYGRIDANSSQTSVVLPGLTNEIESYPCTGCNNERIFMTRAGLQKHADAGHPDKIGEIMELADLIQKEWERRRSLSISMVKMDADEQREFAASDISMTKSNQGNVNEAECRRSNFLLDSTRPGDIQKQQMLASHPPSDPVMRTCLGMGSAGWTRPNCDFCHLQFLDGNALETHIGLNHRRCPLCGKMCPNIGQLNEHRWRVHGIGMEAAAAANATTTKYQPSNHGAHQMCRQFPARVQCEFCGLIMVRPSLLIRHMVRVHNRSTNFSANLIYTQTSVHHPPPPLAYRVDPDGNLLWNCCGNDFENKHTLLAHRTEIHPIEQPSPQMLVVQQQGEMVLMDEQQFPAQNGGEYLGESRELVDNDEMALGIEDGGVASSLLPNFYPPTDMGSLFEGLEEEARRALAE